MRPAAHIRVPIEWTPLSSRAFRVATSLAQIISGEVIVLGVVPFAVQMYGPPTEDYLEHLFEKLKRIVPSNPSVPVRHILREGTPLGSILQMARDAHCDLIVMGTHGRTGLNRLVNGSVAEEVIRKAPCPVLVLKSGDRCDAFDLQASTICDSTA
jgi:universal stress protein A